MRMQVCSSVVLLSIATLSIATGAQQSRDAGSSTPPVVVHTGTAVLSGTLLTDETTPRPVRRAVVRLSSAGMSTRVVGTDDAGQFVFAALPPGSYTLSATKTGFVTAFHGSKRPGRGPGVPVAIADGQRTAVTLKILPGAVIAGTITDSRGNGVPSIPVMAVEVRPAGATSAVPSRATTDDRGAYRIFGLAPGEYVVSAVPPRLTTGRLSGPLPDVFGVTDAEVQWARGGGGPPPPSGRPVVFAPVFFPGTTDPGAAAKVTVASGTERTDVGFSLRIVATTRIAGTLIDPNGQAVTSATVTLFPRRGNQPSVSEALISSGALVLPRAVVAAQGFSMAGVTPGEYTLVARTGSGGRGTVGQPAEAPPLWNVTDITVDGTDQTDLVLRLQPGMTISGSVVFERSTLTPPADLSRLDLSMAETGTLVGAPATPRATVDPSGAFRFRSVFPGTYALKVTPLSAPAGGRWTLKSAIFNGRNAADVPLDVKPGENITGLVLTFTDRITEIAGRLIDGTGEPVTRYSIIVFTVDRSLWLPNSTRVRSTTPATNGSFSISGLPPGEYAIAAAEDVETSDLADPTFLTQALAAAYHVTLAEGERKTQDLKVGR